MARTAPWHDVDYYYDATGRLVSLGERVAYNLSGSVAIGKVTRIRVQRWRKDLPNWSDKYRITIAYEKGCMRYKLGHESLVTRTQNTATLEHYVLGGGDGT